VYSSHRVGLFKSGCKRGVCSKREVQRGVEQVHVHAKHISTQAKMLAISASSCAKCGSCSWPELCVMFSRTCQEGSAKDVRFVKKTQKCQRTVPIILMLGKRRPFSPLEQRAIFQMNEFVQGCTSSLCRICSCAQHLVLGKLAEAKVSMHHESKSRKQHHLCCCTASFACVRVSRVLVFFRPKESTGSCAKVRRCHTHVDAFSPTWSSHQFARIFPNQWKARRVESGEEVVERDECKLKFEPDLRCQVFEQSGLASQVRLS